MFNVPFLRHCVIDYIEIQIYYDNTCLCVCIITAGFGGVKENIRVEINFRKNISGDEIDCLPITMEYSWYNWTTILKCFIS